MNESIQRAYNALNQRMTNKLLEHLHAQRDALIASNATWASHPGAEYGFYIDGELISPYSARTLKHSQIECRSVTPEIHPRAKHWFTRYKQTLSDLKLMDQCIQAIRSSEPNMDAGTFYKALPSCLHGYLYGCAISPHESPDPSSTKLPQWQAYLAEKHAAILVDQLLG